MVRDARGRTVITRRFVPFGHRISLVNTHGGGKRLIACPLARGIRISNMLTLSATLRNADKLRRRTSHVFSTVTSRLSCVNILTVRFFSIRNGLLIGRVTPHIRGSNR